MSRDPELLVNYIDYPIKVLFTYIDIWDSVLMHTGPCGLHELVSVECLAASFNKGLIFTLKRCGHPGTKRIKSSLHNKLHTIQLEKYPILVE